ncbi:MAG: DUF3127 domain-containing protein [Bacteroidetes bacterium]|nr:MAG: DUF3127 domain-containing protein [Bacteroidota bacterium]
MSFEIVGKLYKKFDTEVKSERFQAREFVLLVEDGPYPQYVKFQLTQERCNLIDQYEEGDLIKVHFDLRGREWQGKFFTNLNAWRIESAQSDAPATPDAPPAEGDFPTAADEPADTGDFEDLPF